MPISETPLCREAELRSPSLAKPFVLLSHVDIRQVGARRLAACLSGPSPHGQDDDGETPLHMAAEHGHAKTFQMLLDEGADVILLTDP